MGSLETGTLTGKGTIPLNDIVLVQLLKIKRPCFIISLKKLRDESREEETETTGEIVGLLKLASELCERDLAAIVRKYACAKK